MKRILKTLSASCLALLCCAGCWSGYYSQIEDMNARAEQLEQQLESVNETLRSVVSLANALESKDFVTGVSSIMDPGDPSVTIGYQINFVKNQPVCIYNGVNGKVPYVGTAIGEDNLLYWTVRYEGGDAYLLKDADGNPVACMGQAPYITVRDKSWYITFDGVTYTKLGPADGKDADDMFKSFDTSDPDFVRIELSDGRVIKLPTFTSYEHLMGELDHINATIATQQALIQAKLDDLIYIKGISPIIENDRTVGSSVELSDGRICNIYDVNRSNIPEIAPRQDDADGIFYWAMRYGSEEWTWICSDDGTKIRAIGETSQVPTVTMAFDAASGKYCWAYCSADGSTAFIRDADGRTVAAIEEAGKAFFSNVDNSSDDCLVVQSLDGMTFRIPKMYSIEMETELSVKPNTSFYLPYKVYGDESNATTLIIMAQPGFKVENCGDGRLLIDVPSDFVSGRGQIVIVFNVCGFRDRVVVKTVNLINANGR